jgi:phage-related protein
MSSRARTRFGILLRQLQLGESLGMPQSRPMPSVGARCHELRVADGRVSWRLVYRLDRDAVIVLDVFGKRTAETPHPVVEACRERLRRYDSVAGDER